MNGSLTSVRALTEALLGAATTVEVEAPGRWHLGIGAAAPIDAEARVNGEWLVLWAPLPAALAPRSPWSLLQFNSHFAGGVRVAQARDARNPQLRIDVSLVAPGGERRVLQAAEALRGAVTEVANGHLDHALAAADDLPAAPYDAGSQGWEWLSQLEGFPWPHRVLDDGRLRVELDARGGRYTVFASQADHSIHLRVLLVTAPRLPTPCGKALGVALLAASGAVHLVRPTAERVADGMRIGLEVVTRLEAVPQDLVLEVGALQAACDLFGPETRALRDPVLASVYLDTTTPPARATLASGRPHRDVTATPGHSTHGELHVLHRIA